MRLEALGRAGAGHRRAEAPCGFAFVFVGASPFFGLRRFLVQEAWQLSCFFVCSLELFGGPPNCSVDITPGSPLKMEATTNWVATLFGWLAVGRELKEVFPRHPISFHDWREGKGRFRATYCRELKGNQRCWVWDPPKGNLSTKEGFNSLFARVTGQLGGQFGGVHWFQFACHHLPANFVRKDTAAG